MIQQWEEVYKLRNTVISRMITHSIMTALRAVEQEIKRGAKAGRIPISAGFAAGAVVGWLTAGLVGAVIGGMAGALVIDSYKRQ